MTNWYRAYGLTISATFEIPELRPVGPNGSPADVVIDQASLPSQLEDPTTSTPYHDATSSEMLLRIEDVGRYLVAEGARITVDPLSKASAHDIRVFLLGTCFGALLHQRGALVLHASGIGTPNGAVLFAGQSGSGKSTLLGEMLRRGHKMMVDDVSALFPADQGDGLVIQPSYPRTRLWSDAAQHLEVEVSDLQRTRSHMDKYERQLPEQFWDQAAPLRRIYHLAGAAGEQLSLTRVPQIAVVPIVVNNTYRQVFLDGFEIRQHHFELASRIARSVPVIQIVRPEDGFRLRELADMVLADLDDS